MDLHISEWMKVITDPLGLAGFVVFLLFVFFARAAKQRAAPGVAVLLIILAGVGLVGGLTLAYFEHGVSSLQGASNVIIHGAAKLNAGHSGTAVISGHDTDLSQGGTSLGAARPKEGERGSSPQGASNVIIHGAATLNAGHSGTAVISGHDTALTPHASSTESVPSGGQQQHRP